ncbi:MAG TPA: hypothetical protein VH253_17510 [Phycisphaerae bacterium]|nr:hypothetical protein [Phycisphaerae bacterium]
MHRLWRAVSTAAIGLAAAFPLTLAAQTPVASAPPGGAAGTTAAARMLADQLVDEAFGYTRDPKAPEAQSSLRASLLLEFASRLDPSDARILKLLVEASQVAGRGDVQRSALRALIKADPGDMVAQVEYLDFLAGATQALDERARVYQSALDTQSLDPTVRSEMAVRLARIAEERGDQAGARALLGQAMKLNDVNVRALREWVRMTEKKPDERVEALSALLTADPYEPDGWMALARLLESAGVHGRAADALSTAIEQSQKDGGQPPADLFQELAVELAISARRAEAAPIIDALAKLRDAPLSALVAARLIANEYVAVPGSLTGANPPASAPATQPATAASQPRRAIGFIDVPPAPARVPGQLDYTMILRRKLLDDMQSKTPEALAQAAWVELSVMPEPSRDVESWLNDYATAVGKDAATDKTLARLRGWLLLRTGKAAAAQAALAPLADADPLAQLGLARALIELHQSAEAARQLQDLWRQYPQGIFALQIAQAARSAQIPLADTVLATRYAGVVGDIPPDFWAAQRQPRDIELLSPADLDPRYNLGQPILLDLTITNVSNHPLPVGPDGAIKTSIGVVGVAGIGMAGMGGGKPLGLYALENLQRVYRLAPRGQIKASIRLDQGRLGTLFTSQPMNSFNLTFSLITAPRGNPEKPEYGLGGQVVTVQPPGVLHVGIPLTPETANAELDTVFRAITNGTPEQQLNAIAVASALLATLPPPGNDPAAKVEVVRKMLCNALLPPLRSPSAVTRAWTLRYLPATGLTSDLASAVQSLNDDPDPIVRAAWATNEVVLGESAPGQREPAIQAIRQQEGMEADPVAKAWMRTILEELVPPSSASGPAR